MSSTTRTLLTAQEFMEKYANVEGWRELVRGEVIELPNPGFNHGYVCSAIVQILGVFARQSGLGYVLCNDSAVQTTFDPDSLRGADVTYFSHARLPRTRSMPSIPPVAPDLIVEVRSPSDRPGAIRAKLEEYLALGVMMVWIVDPERRTLTLHRPGQPESSTFGEADVLEGLPELPGFRCDVGEMLP